MFAIWMTALVQRWRQHDTLRELRKLDDRQLADIGLTRGQLASVSIGRDASNRRAVRA